MKNGRIIINFFCNKIDTVFNFVAEKFVQKPFFSYYSEIWSDYNWFLCHKSRRDFDFVAEKSIRIWPFFTECVCVRNCVHQMLVVRWSGNDWIESIHLSMGNRCVCSSIIAGAYLKFNFLLFTWRWDTWDGEREKKNNARWSTCLSSDAQCDNRFSLPRFIFAQATKEKTSNKNDASSHAFAFLLRLAFLFRFFRFDRLETERWETIRALRRWLFRLRNPTPTPKFFFFWLRLRLRLREKKFSPSDSTSDSEEKFSRSPVWTPKNSEIFLSKEKDVWCDFLWNEGRVAQ